MLRADGTTYHSAVEDEQSDGGVRSAGPADLPSLLELEQHFPSDRLSRRSLRRLLGRAAVLAYEENGRVLGNIITLYRRNSTRARLYSLVVHPDYQGRGIATTLLNDAERAAHRHGCTILSLEVRDDTGSALRLYQKRGYSVTGRVENYYDDGAPALRLEKSVAHHM